MPPHIQQIDWDEFRRKNKDTQKSFENLCYLLFCREHKQSGGIFGYKNQVGIEKEPILIKRRWHGFQSKFFEGTSVNWSVFREPLKKAKSKNPHLQVIRFYINLDFKESGLSHKKKSTKHEEVEKYAKEKGLTIEWFGPSQFLAALSSPSNFDLAQLYFGVTDELGFINNGVNHRIQTFLQSDEHLDLPMEISGKIIKGLGSSILRSKQKSFMVIGSPGSGKSILIHALFAEFGGLKMATKEKMLKVLERNKAIPMIINLKDCHAESLENLIRDRQNDSRIRSQNLGFIYLLDGLDELSEEDVDQILSFSRELEQQEDTKKIIISCRSGNPNRIKARGYFPEIPEFQFCDLQIGHIESFFSVKGDTTKIKSLKGLRKSNPKILSEIRDILLIRLLWETIQGLGPDSDVTDLVSKKINLLMNSPDHKKNIESLNLLDPKARTLTDLNQEISFQFQKVFQYRFSQEELQKLILLKFPRLDYGSTNKILNYLSNLFFEASYPNDGPGQLPSQSYIYQHRRYQEFFFIQRLKLEYEKDPTILRKLDILSNRDFFEEYFLPYARKDYERREDVVGLLDLNLIDVYLGNHSGFGVDDAYYLNSQEFIPALAHQDPRIVDELLESENFRVKKILFVDTEELRSQFQKWSKDKTEYRVTRYLSSIWSDGVGSLIEHIVIFWKSGNKEIANRLLINLNEAVSIYKENKYLEQVEPNQKPTDPFWKQWEDYLFIKICIRGEKILDVFENLIRYNYANFQEEEPVSRKDEGRAKLVNSFFRVVLDYKPNEIFKGLEQLDDFELRLLLGTLCSHHFIGLLISNQKLQKKIKELLDVRAVQISEKRYDIAFLKAFLGLPFTEEENQTLREISTKCRNERTVDWHFDGTPFKFALISFALKENSFENMEAKDFNPLHYYDELALYAALFDAFVSILSHKKTLPQIVRDYTTYVKRNERYYGPYLKVENSFLWAHIFNAARNLPGENLILLREQVVREELNIIPYSFYYRLALINKNLFDTLVSEIDLIKIEDSLSNAEDYQSLVNNCFSLATFYSTRDEAKSRSYFIRGLKEGVLRHGWRKDTIVSYQLVSALGLLLKKGWIPRQEVEQLVEEVFDLTLRVGEFTDGKGTWRGPYNVIDLAVDYDLPLAVKLKDKLIEKRGRRNFSNDVIASILLGQAKRGVALDEIELGMQEYHQNYHEDHTPYSDSYEQTMKVYVAVAESDLYTDKERQRAFEAAYKQVETLKKYAESSPHYYYLNDSYFRELKERYLILCKKFKKKPNASIDKPEDKNYEYDPELEKKFLSAIKKANTPVKIRRLYKQLSDFKNNIQLSQQKSWYTLVHKTKKICGNISLFLKLLDDNNFPHTDFFTTNSKYFYLGLAAALNDLSMRQEAIRHLYKSTGHGGFGNMIEVYAHIGDKEMSRKLFSRYLQLCHFLAD